MYHRFPTTSSLGAENQMAHLRRYYHVTSLTDLGKRLADGSKLCPRTVVFTVDDGYKDFYETAFPIFQKYQIPAILFLTSGFIDRQHWMCGDRIIYCLQNTRKREIQISMDQHESLRLICSQDQLAISITLLKEAFKNMDASTCKIKLAELESLSGVNVPDDFPPQFAPCTWDQIREMSQSGIEFGAHTVTHPMLAKVGDMARVRFEMIESKQRIEQELQKPVRHFAYPNGRWQDFGIDSVNIAREQFDTAVSAVPGWNYQGRTDRHQLFRTSADPGGNLESFERGLSGFHAHVRNGQPRHQDA
jgi:hypothetical protein